jgi:hypothetical protein
MLKRALQGVLAALVLLVPAASKAQAWTIRQCDPYLYQQGVYFYPDTSTPGQVTTFYYFTCNNITDQVSVPGDQTLSACPGVRSELQGVVAADDCYTGAADPYYGGTDTFTILDSTTYCNDNLLSHKQHFGAETVTWYERDPSTNTYYGPFTLDLMTTWFNGPNYNRRCGVL